MLLLQCSWMFAGVLPSNVPNGNYLPHMFSEKSTLTLINDATFSAEVLCVSISSSLFSQRYFLLFFSCVPNCDRYERSCQTSVSVTLWCFFVCYSGITWLVFMPRLICCVCFMLVVVSCLDGYYVRATGVRSEHCHTAGGPIHTLIHTPIHTLIYVPSYIPL